jgi:hypothetical protein
LILRGRRARFSSASRAKRAASFSSSAIARL